MSPYREAPVAPQKAPRASWWRRFWHRDLTGPLFIHRLRHSLKREFPHAPWRTLQDLATAEYGAIFGGRGDSIDSAISELVASEIRDRLIAERRALALGALPARSP